MSSNFLIVSDAAINAVMANLPDNRIFEACVQGYLEKIQAQDQVNQQAHVKKENENKEFFNALIASADIEDFIVSCFIQYQLDQAKEEAQLKAAMNEKDLAQKTTDEWRAAISQTPATKTDMAIAPEAIDQTKNKIDDLIAKISEACFLRQNQLNQILDTWKQAEWKPQAVAIEAFDKTAFNSGLVFGAQNAVVGKAALIAANSEAKMLTDMMKYTPLGEIVQNTAREIKATQPEIKLDEAFKKAVLAEGKPRMDLMAQIRQIGALRQAGKTNQECLKIGVGMNRKDKELIKQDALLSIDDKQKQEAVLEQVTLYNQVLNRAEMEQYVAAVGRQTREVKQMLDDVKDNFIADLYAHQEFAINNRAEYFAVGEESARMIAGLEIAKENLLEVEIANINPAMLDVLPMDMLDQDKLEIASERASSLPTENKTQEAIAIVENVSIVADKIAKAESITETVVAKHEQVQQQRPGS